MSVTIPTNAEIVSWEEFREFEFGVMGRLVISLYGLIKCNNLENAFNVHFSREISRENH